MIDLTIIIVGYNTKKLITDCIESVYKEASKISKEVIVVDNASSDGSQKELRNYWRKYKNLTLIEDNKNLGFSKAVNQGIDKAKGEFVLLLNPDTNVKKGALGKLVKFARKKSDAGVVGARLRNLDGTIQDSCYNFPTVINAIKQYWLGQARLFDKYYPKGNSPSTVDAVVGGAFLITPKALKRVGKLDERYFMYFEDIEYCRNVWKNGLKVYYLPSAEIIHHHGASGKKIAPEKDQWRRLIPSSKIYHGLLKHYLLFGIMWTGQKWRKL